MQINTKFEPGDVVKCPFFERKNRFYLITSVSRTVRKDIDSEFSSDIISIGLRQISKNGNLYGWKTFWSYDYHSEEFCNLTLVRKGDNKKEARS